MKKNGFVFAEAIIVIAILAIALLVVYRAFNTALINEKSRLEYDNPTYLYRVYYIKDFLDYNGLNGYYQALKSNNSIIMTQINCTTHVDQNTKSMCDNLITPDPNPNSVDKSSPALKVSKVYLSKGNIKDLITKSSTEATNYKNNSPELYNYLRSLDNYADGYIILAEFKENCKTIYGINNTPTTSCDYNFASVNIKESRLKS